MNEIVWRAHPSWRGMLSWYIKAIAAAAAFSAIVYLADRQGDIGWGYVALAIIVSFGLALGIGYLKRYSTTYTITRRDVFEKSGILNTRQERAMIEKITNITVERSLVERIAGIGRVNIDTAGEQLGEDKLDFWGIKDPYGVERTLDELRLEAEDAR